jgi:hypothetical protein
MFITTRPAVIARRKTSGRDGIEDLGASCDETSFWLSGLQSAAVREYESMSNLRILFSDFGLSVPAAVHRQALSVDKRRFRTCEERHGLSNLVHFPEAADAGKFFSVSANGPSAGLSSVSIGAGWTLFTVIGQIS